MIVIFFPPSNCSNGHFKITALFFALNVFFWCVSFYCALALSLFLRVPLPHCGSHPNAAEDQTQAGSWRQEAHFSLREENSIKERQSKVSISHPSYSDAAVLFPWVLFNDMNTIWLAFSWYKDGELLEYSHPNYISLKDDHITIVANAINEGTYTCIVKKKDKVLTNYSWRVRVRF